MNKTQVSKIIKPDKQDQIVYIPIFLLDENKNPVREVDGSSITDLRLSIEKYGILQPLVVRKSPNQPSRFEVVCGNHRLYASRGAGLTHIPCVVKELKDMESFLLSLQENVQRVNMSPIEEGKVFFRLIDEFFYRERELSDLIGKGSNYIVGRIRIYKNLHEDLKNELGKNLSVTNALYLSKLPIDHQLDALEEIKESKKRIKNLRKNPSYRGGGLSSGMWDGPSFCQCPNCGAKHVRGYEHGMIITLGKPVKLKWIGRRIFSHLIQSGVQYNKKDKTMIFSSIEQTEILTKKGYKITIV